MNALQSRADEKEGLEKWIRRAAEAVNLLIKGHGNFFGSLTVAVATTSTVVADQNATPSSIPLLMATNANAAALIGSATGVYVSARAAGSFTLTHPAPAGSATFVYVLHGG